MEIYFIGYIIVPLGLFFFFVSPKRLYELMIFSIPFTGTAVFQVINSSFSIEGIRPSLFLGLLCLIRHFISITIRKSVKVNLAMRFPLILLFMFAFVCIISLAMPSIIDGKMSVLDSYSHLVMYAEPQPLSFKFQYVTQLAYLLFGCFLAYYVAIKNDSKEKIERSIQIYLYATLFVCCWGLLELILHYSGVPYPSFLFNQVSINLRGTLLLDGKPRITSVSLEPSIMSQQLLTALPLIFWPVWYKNQDIANINVRLLLLIVCVLLLSTSSSAFFGLGVFLVVVLSTFVKQRKINVYVLFGFIVGVILAFLALPLVYTELVEKLTTFSGEERLKALTFGWHYFVQYPILGIGWGVFPIWDVVMCILTGVGITGLTIFLFVLILIRHNFASKISGGNPSVLHLSMWHSFLMLILISQFSGFIYHSQYFWLILGLAISTSALKEEDLSAE